MTETAAGADARRIIVLPNCSLTKRQARAFVAFVGTASLLVAGGFAVLGFWPILPFAGLEIGLLALALRLCRRDAAAETISVTQDSVFVDGGRATDERRYNRHWAGVRLHAPHASKRGQVTIAAHGTRREIGAALTDQARARLWTNLQALIGPAAYSPDLAMAPLKAGETRHISNVIDERNHWEHI